MKALETGLGITRISACKLLFFFVQFQGAEDGKGNVINAIHLFSKALSDSDTNVQWQALVQLQHIHSLDYISVLNDYIKVATHQRLLNEGELILKSMQDFKE